MSFISSVPRFWLTLPVHLALLAGTIVAIVLLIRHRNLPAGLALAGFGGLFLARILAQAWDAFLIRQLIRGEMPELLTFDRLIWIRPASGCCCNIVGTLAMVCLLIGFWKAVTGEKIGGQA